MQLWNTLNSFWSPFPHPSARGSYYDWILHAAIRYSLYHFIYNQGALLCFSSHESKGQVSFTNPTLFPRRRRRKLFTFRHLWSCWANCDQTWYAWPLWQGLPNINKLEGLPSRSPTSGTIFDMFSKSTGPTLIKLVVHYPFDKGTDICTKWRAYPPGFNKGVKHVKSSDPILTKLSK